MVENEVRTLKDLVNFAAEKYGERDYIRFVVDKQIQSRSYLDLKKCSESVSRMFAEKKIEGVHFAIAGKTSFEWIAAYMGVVNSKNIIVPYDVKEKKEDISFLLKHSDCEGIIYDRSQKRFIEYLKENNKELKYFISLDSLEHDGEVLSVKKIFEEYESGFSMDIEEEFVSTILYTSGTTGIRKGVMLTTKGLARSIMNYREKTFDDDPCVKLSVLPIHHIFCFCCDVLVSLRFGYTICVGSNVSNIFKDAQVYKPTRITVVPAVVKFMYESIVKEHTSRTDAGEDIALSEVAKEMFGGRITGCSCGGAYAEPSVLDSMAKLGIPTFSGYGMTECSSVVSGSSIRHNKLGSVGRLLNNNEIKIQDNELLIKNEGVMKGYYKDPKSTEEAMQDGWFKSGDYGYMDEEGYLFITGRKKNLIILANGENVSPEEVEIKLYKQPIVQEVIVYGRDEKICAEIFPNQEYIKDNNIEDVEEAINRAVFEANMGLPVYKKVGTFVIREEEFEKTSAGKIKRTEGLTGAVSFTVGKK